MTDEDATIVTAYGRLDRAALVRAQSNYDKTALLSAVDELDRILARVRGQDGLRDNLLQLHGMAHVVINGAGLSGCSGYETLPELTFDATPEILQIITTLQIWVKLIEPLEGPQVHEWTERSHKEGDSNNFLAYESKLALSRLALLMRNKS